MAYAVAGWTVPHTANETMRSLKDYFGRRIISKKNESSLAPRSPNLNPLDFFIWGYCKENVYRNNPEYINDEAYFGKHHERNFR